MATETTESTGKTIKEVSSAIQQASQNLDAEAEGAAKTPANVGDESQVTPEDGAVIEPPEPRPLTPEDMAKNPQDIINDEIVKEMAAAPDTPDGDADAIEKPRTFNDVVRDIRNA